MVPWRLAHTCSFPKNRRLVPLNNYAIWLRCLISQTTKGSIRNRVAKTIGRLERRWNEGVGFSTGEGLFLDCFEPALVDEYSGSYTTHVASARLAWLWLWFIMVKSRPQRAWRTHISNAGSWVTYRHDNCYWVVCRWEGGGISVPDN